MVRAPKWFTAAAIVALLWNLLGCFAFYADLRLTPEDVAKLGAAQQAMYASRPAWSVAATGVAVVAGALGCIGLIMRKRWSFALLVLSLVGVVAQDISLFVMSSAAPDTIALVLQGVVLVVAVALILLARKATNSDWLS
jgi:hypothetical protein